MAGEQTPTPVSVPLDWLPWHDGARARLETALAGGRLPHGLLLHGPDGVGKEHIAAVLAAGLFCSGRREGLTPCGECPECALSRAASHPDLHWLRRPEDKKSIGVDAVREACDQLGMTSMRGGYRVAIVTPAHLKTHNAMNALLKTLEEPAPRHAAGADHVAAFGPARDPAQPLSARRGAASAGRAVEPVAREPAR